MTLVLAAFFCCGFGGFEGFEGVEGVGGVGWVGVVVPVVYLSMLWLVSPVEVL